MKTLQECKDEIAKKEGWRQHPVSMVNDAYFTEVAELYASQQRLPSTPDIEKRLSLAHSIIEGSFDEEYRKAWRQNIDVGQQHLGQLCNAEKMTEHIKKLEEYFSLPSPDNKRIWDYDGMLKDLKSQLDSLTREDKIKILNDYREDNKGGKEESNLHEGIYKFFEDFYDLNIGLWNDCHFEEKKIAYFSFIEGYIHRMKEIQSTPSPFPTPKEEPRKEEEFKVPDFIKRVDSFFAWALVKTKKDSLHLMEIGALLHEYDKLYPNGRHHSNPEKGKEEHSWISESKNALREVINDLKTYGYLCKPTVDKIKLLLK